MPEEAPVIRQVEPGVGGGRDIRVSLPLGGGASASRKEEKGDPPFPNPTNPEASSVPRGERALSTGPGPWLRERLLDAVEPLHGNDLAVAQRVEDPEIAGRARCSRPAAARARERRPPPGHRQRR